jgi:hypothetical protein
VGYLELVKASDGEQLYREFVEGLQSHGYIGGRNLRIVRRSAGAQPQRLRSLAAELAAAKVEIILATTVEAARSAKLGAPGIAAVFVISADPILEGLVASLSRPAGRLTGLVTRGQDLTAKRPQFLKEAFPKISAVAMVGSNLSISRVAFDIAAARLHLSILQFAIYQLVNLRAAEEYNIALPREFLTRTDREIRQADHLVDAVCCERPMLPPKSNPGHPWRLTPNPGLNRTGRHVTSIWRALAQPAG